PPWKLRGRDGGLELEGKSSAPAGLLRLLEHAGRSELSERLPSAAELRAGLEEFRGGRSPARPRRVRRWSLRRLRAPLAALGLAATALFWLGRYTIRDRAAPARPAFEDHSACARPPAPALGANLLANPGLDGPCGWHLAPSARELLAAPAPGGSAAVLRDDGQRMWQRIDVRPLAEAIRGGCKVTFRARLRSLGARDAGGRPYLHGVAMREETSEWVHLSGFSPESASAWTPREHTWELPAGTKFIQIELNRSAVVGSANRGEAWFDDVEVIVENSR
ncbi:MAG: hypothetical protein MUF57_02050, partial [Gammaproteobacteria bacterium]|nr:hypothetical protein [Gammaproteobacteria bacterium]